MVGRLGRDNGDSHGLGVAVLRDGVSLGLADRGHVDGHSRTALGGLRAMATLGRRGSDIGGDIGRRVVGGSEVGRVVGRVAVVADGRGVRHPRVGGRGDGLGLGDIARYRVSHRSGGRVTLRSRLGVVRVASRVPSVRGRLGASGLCRRAAASWVALGLGGAAARGVTLRLGAASSGVALGLGAASGGVALRLGRAAASWVSLRLGRRRVDGITGGRRGSGDGVSRGRGGHRARRRSTSWVGVSVVARVVAVTTFDRLGDGSANDGSGRDGNGTHLELRCRGLCSDCLELSIRGSLEMSRGDLERTADN